MLFCNAGEKHSIGLVMGKWSVFYLVTDNCVGKEEFEKRMFEISCKPINIFLNFNAVIVNLESMEKRIAEGMSG